MAGCNQSRTMLAHHLLLQPTTHLNSSPCPIFRVTWLATSLLTLLKDRSERMLGSTRDLLYIFLLFVAFKVDDPMSFTWKVVFLIPWMWFSALALLSVMVSAPPVITSKTRWQGAAIESS